MNDDQLSLSRRNMIQAASSLALGSSILLSGCSQANVLPKPKELPHGSFYKRVDDIDMYCEVSGQGPLLINQTGAWIGSISGENSVVRPWITELEKRFTVLTFDARGQGRTTLGKGPVSYGRLAADTVRLMDVLGIPSAHFFGHSDGGCIQLDLLLHFSDRVKTSTLVGTPYNHQSYTASLRHSFDRWFNNSVNESNVFHDLEGKPITTEALNAGRQAYAKTSPHPDKYDEVLRQQRRCWSTEPNISMKQLSIIDRPALVVNAGSDPYIPTESMQALAAAIPNARRIDLPDLTHDISPFMHEIAEATSNFIKDNMTLSG